MSAQDKLPQSPHPHEANTDRVKKVVRFSSPDLWETYFEDPNLSKELQESRISDFSRQKADKMRMERIISPVLTAEHRRRVFERLCYE